MTKKQELISQVHGLAMLGLRPCDIDALLRASTLLHRWHAHLCNGDIQIDEESGKAFYSDNLPCINREKQAIALIETVIDDYPGLEYVLQRDPRGAPLHIKRRGDTESRMIAVYDY